MATSAERYCNEEQKCKIMASEKMKYILRRAEQSALRTDIELSPMKREIESIFNPRNIDTDCNMISDLLLPYERKIKEDMSKGNYRKAFETFLEILESLSYHFVKDDMYCPDYTCSDILKSIISEIKSGKVAIEDVAYLDAGMSKIAQLESYEDYGSPFCVMDWERYKG